MGQDKGQERTAVEDRTPEQLRQDIEQTRTDLGDTVAALAAKTDVKARAKEKVDEIKHATAEKAESVKQAAAEKTESLKQAAAEKTGAGTSGSDPYQANAPDSGPNAAAKASALAGKIKTKAQENPTVAAAGAAFVGGFVLGRLRSR
jgi:Protein of unknown function (DUF3618)